MGNTGKSLRDGLTAGGPAAVVAAFLTETIGLSVSSASVIGLATAAASQFVYRYGRVIVKRYVRRRWPALLRVKE